MPTEELPLAAPWETWHLDADFFSALSKWTIENPTTTLDRVLERVCNAIELGRDFFELIPGGTFPARGLVLSLTQLVKLGKMVSTAKADVQAFAKEVVRWVSEIKSTFTATQSRWIGGRFTSTTWKNLAGVRDLIDEICKWATSRLSDRRWSLNVIQNRLMVKQEINDFRARMAEARTIFRERTMISQAWGIDAILQMISRISDRQKRMEAMLRKIKATQEEHLRHIRIQLEANEAEDTRRREAKERRRYVAQMLSKHAIGNTSYDNQGKPPCDKDTRVDILKEITGWVSDTSPASQSFLWLTGDPGCGKSAITASLAKDCKDKDILWAQFFINRNNVNTTDPNAYFPSIARQLAARSDLVELKIHDRLKAKPSLMDAMSPEQATALFIDAIRVASGIEAQKPVVIVIDGLDETDRAHLKSTADILSQLFDDLSNHPNAKIFISSRTEDDIRNPFARTMNNQCVKHLHLDVASESSIKDVSMYLRRLIAEIVLDHDLDWREWPGDERMEVLALRASGLFIWAVTAAKFFRQQIDAWGTECLDDVLDKLNSEGMGDINTLYGLILSFTYTDRADEWAFDSFRRLIGAFVVLNEPLSIGDISQLLDLRRSPSSRQVDVVRFVKQLRTVLVAGTESIDGRIIPRLHKSFFEFITSDSRVEPRFRVNADIAHREVGLQCIRQLALSRSATTSLQMPVIFRYAFRFWSQHLLQGLGTTSGFLIADKAVNLMEFQRFLQRSSNSRSAAPIFVAFSYDRSGIQASLGRRTRTWDINDGVDDAPSFTSNPDSIRNPEYNTAVSPVVCFPNGRHVAWVALDKNICLWDTQSRTTHRTFLLAHRTQAISTIAFSPDCRQFVSGTAKGDLFIWNTQSGQQVGISFRGHGGFVTCAAFSQKDNLLVAGYSDGFLEFWDIQTCTTPLAVYNVHKSWVRAVTFSPNGIRALSCSDDSTIRLYDTRTSATIHNLEHLRFEGHTKGVKAVSFSPDGKYAVSGSLDLKIYVWDVQSGEHIGLPLEGHGAVIQSVIFSSDGKQIISGSADGSIRIWDVATRRLIGSPLTGHEGSVRSVAISPDGNYIFSGSGDQTIRIWTSKNALHDTFETKLTAFSPNGRQVVTVSHDHQIRLWDVEIQQPSGLRLQSVVQPGAIHLVAFSPDGSRIAASSSDNVYVWDSGGGSLLASTRLGSLPSTIKSLYFTDDTQGLVTQLSTGSKCLLELADGEPIKATGALEVSRIKSSQPFFQEGQTEYSATTLPGNMRWFPQDTADACLWALINDHIIRARKDGSVTVVPVSWEKNTLDGIRVPPKGNSKTINRTRPTTSPLSDDDIS